MVVDAAKWMLLNTKVDPLKIATAYNIEEKDCWDYIIDYSIEQNILAKQRDESHVRAEARDWANSLPEAYETKRLVLLERLKNATSEKEKQERLTHYKLFTNRLQSLSAEQIERARNYPLKDLLNTNKNIAKCPFHDDRTASLNIKNNFYHCHGCNLSGDTIDFIMKRDGYTFKEAVLKLT